MIKFKNVTKRYGKHVAVDNISFNINEGEFFVLIGPSGCGKTTTLKMINRLIHLSEGYIYFKDKPISDYPVYEMRWDIGYVLRRDCIIPTYDNQRKYCTSATNEKVERKRYR